MSTKKGWWIVLLASAILLACAVGLQFNGSAQAAAPQGGVTVPYSGRLTDTGGLPVSDGKYDFTFTLYDTASGGTPAWFETQTGLAVQSGSFTAQLGRAALLPASAKDGQKWLAVSVRGPGEAGFTALEPRQALGALLAPAAPAAGPSCAHDHLGETWPAAGAFPTLFGTHGLRISTSGSGAGIDVAMNTPEGALTGAAVNALNDGSGIGVNSNTSSGDAVRAKSQTGTGLWVMGSPAVKALGSYKTNADSILYLSPHDMIIRGSAGMTLTPTGSGAMVIRNDSATGEKYVSLPVSTFGMLFGSPLYVSSAEVCYQVNTAASGKINATGVFKNNGADGWATYLYDGTQRGSTSRLCYTASSTLPRTVIDNSTWVQLNLGFGGTGATSDITIYSVKLTLSELADPNAAW